VAQIQGLCAQMDRLWRSIPAKGQRDLWKRWGSSSDPWFLLAARLQLVVPIFSW
jgi:hypothetical protein